MYKKIKKEKPKNQEKRKEKWSSKKLYMKAKPTLEYCSLAFCFFSLLIEMAHSL